MICKRAKSYFSAEVRKRGFLYFIQDRVTLEKPDASGILTASVHGGELYDVEIRPTLVRKTLFLDMSCT